MFVGIGLLLYWKFVFVLVIAIWDGIVRGLDEY